jgi:hypothetical protein
VALDEWPLKGVVHHFQGECLVWSRTADLCRSDREVLPLVNSGNWSLRSTVHAECPARFLWPVATPSSILLPTDSPEASSRR